MKKKAFNLKRFSKLEDNTVYIHQDDDGKYSFSYFTKDDNMYIDNLNINIKYPEDITDVYSSLSSLKLQLQFLLEDFFKEE